MLKIAAVIVYVYVLLAPHILFAAEKQMTVQGTVDAGTMMSSIVTNDGRLYSFVSDSKVGDKIFRVCKVGDLCSVTGLVEDDEIIQSVTSVKKMIQAYLAIPATEKKDNKNIKERKKVELKGIIQSMHNPAGAYFGLIVGKGQDYILSYAWDINDNLSDKLNELIDSKQKVTVRGTLRIWKDGSASFDNSEPIEIYK